MDADEQARLRTWLEVAAASSYYELLGVLELADAQTIQQAFHDFALAFHPDVHVGASGAIRDAARDLFRLGAEAYRVLSNDALRDRYDAGLAEGKLRLDAATAVRGGGGAAASSLEKLCKTPGARYAARKADALLDEGRLGEAREALTEALARDDYDNAALEDRLEALDTAIFVMGG